MTNLVDLRSALRLLTAISASQDNNISASKNSASSNDLSQTNASASTISVILAQARSSAQSAGLLLSLKPVGDSAASQHSMSVISYDVTLAPASPTPVPVTAWNATQMSITAATASGTSQDSCVLIDNISMPTADESLKSISQSSKYSIYADNIAVYGDTSIEQTASINLDAPIVNEYNFVVADGTAAGFYSTSSLNHYFSALDESAANEFVLENTMTNKQLSNVVYSGDGVTGSSGGDSIDTFADELNELETQTSNGSDLARVSAIEAAYQNGTLTVQNATDVQGLDYQASIVGAYDVANNGSSITSVNYNKGFLAENTDSALVPLGDAMLYVTW